MSNNNTNNYFYLDLRDGNYGCNNSCGYLAADVEIDLNKNWDGNGNSRYEYKIWQDESGSQYSAITDGQVIRVWEIPQVGPPPPYIPKTDCFTDFWTNSLAITQTSNNNPRLVWGPHPTFATTNYKVYRAVSATPVPKPLTLNYALIHTTTATNIFEYTDIDLRLGSWDYIYYYVKAYDSGTDTYSPISNIAQTRAGFYKENSEYFEGAKSSNTFSLSANYPNPFNPSTTINYQIPSKSFVILKVYDVLGNEVAVLVNEWKETGSYTAQFSTSGKLLQSGVYFYQLIAGNFAETKKCIFLK